MKSLLILVFLVCNLFSIDFNDEGSDYNPFTFIKAIKTAENAYTLEFKNEEESYFTNFYIN